MRSTINIEKPADLVAYLVGRGNLSAVESPKIRPLHGGVSNRTVLVQPENGSPFVVKQALQCLRVATDWFSPPERISVEAMGMKYLRKILPKGTVTQLLFEDHDNHIIAMSAVPQPHSTWKEMLLTLPPEASSFEQFAEILSRLHRGSYNNTQLARVFSDTQYFESLRLRPYYEFTARQFPDVRSRIKQLARQALKHKLCLVHGDFSPKNILVHCGQFVLLDHEVIHYGDPAFDIGFSLTHLLAKAINRRQFASEFADSTRQFVLRYLEGLPNAISVDLEPRACGHTLACLLARVAGQSTLEYLAKPERERIKLVALQLFERPPTSLLNLVDHFSEEANA
ncbi:MAG TPA: aminoglycoside phosphotransferase family protein [Acidobacteriaceae bacterium]|jgi:5-methylthioribose kinase